MGTKPQTHSLVVLQEHISIRHANGFGTCHPPLGDSGKMFAVYMISAVRVRYVCKRVGVLVTQEISTLFVLSVAWAETRPDIA